MAADATVATQFFVIQVVVQIIVMIICIWLSDLLKD